MGCPLPLGGGWPTISIDFQSSYRYFLLMGNHTDEHDACLGRAFRRRKEAQQELEAACEQATRLGT